MNKKAQFDLIEIIIFLITLSVLVMITIYVNDKVTTGYKELTPDVNSTAYKAIDKTNLTFKTGYDKLFLGLLFILLIGMGITAYQIQSSPIFIIVFLILTVISTWVSAIISNTYMKIEQTGVFHDSLTYLPMQTFVMEHLPIIIAGFGVILLIVTYSKNILFQRVGIDGQ